MIEQLINLMLKYTAKQYDISEDQAADLIFEKTEDNKVDKTKLKKDALKSFLDKDKERIKVLKDSVDTTEIFTDAFKKAKIKVTSQLEKSLSKTYDIKGDLKLEELVPAILAEQKELLGKDALSDDEIKKHPTYLSLENKYEKDTKTLEADYNTKVENFEKANNKASIFRSAKNVILGVFEGLNPVLSEEATRANNQKQDFLKKFENYDYERIEGSDKDFLILKEGKRLEDGHGNALKIEDLTKNKASELYDFKVQNPKDGPSNKTLASMGLSVPKDQNAYDDAIFNAKSPEERIALADAFEANK